MLSHIAISNFRRKELIQQVHKMYNTEKAKQRHRESRVKERAGEEMKREE